MCADGWRGGGDRHGFRRVHERVGRPVLCVCVLCFDLCPRLDAIQMQKCSVQHGRGRDGKRRGEEREMKMDKGERISKCKRERGGGRVETHPESVI